MALSPCASGQTLGGIGTVNGKVVVQSGATIAPGGTNTILNMTEGSSVTGTLSASNDITLGGNTVMKLNRLGGERQKIISTTKINYGGTLTVANVSGSPLAVGNSFQLFSAPNLNGTFTISPGTPGPGLLWGHLATHHQRFVERHCRVGSPVIKELSRTPPAI